MKIDNTACDAEFIKEVERISGQKVADCYQCGKCSAGCPAGYAMDLLPDKIIRFVQLGMKEETLKSATPWLCASCETCSTRCPQEVELSRVMEAVRKIALAEKAVQPDNRIASFYEIFLNNIKRFGRTFEPGMVAIYNMKTRQPFNEMKSGMIMAKKGKAAFKPSKTANAAEMKKIFERFKAEEK